MPAKFLLCAAASAMLLAPTAVLAVPAPMVWDAASGYGTKPWSYMQRLGAGCSAPATPLGFPYAGPGGTSFVGRQGVNTPTIVPLVAKNLATTGSTVYSSATIPAGALWMHPGETGANPQCAVVRFTAPMAGKFRIQGKIKSIDAGANQVRGYIIVNNAAVAGPLVLSGPMGSELAFDHTVTLLGQPRVIDFALDDGGSYYNDSTQLVMTITRCQPNASQCP